MRTLAVVAALLAFALMQAELALIVLGGAMANQSLVRIITRPQPAWDVFTPQPGQWRDL